MIRDRTVMVKRLREAAQLDPVRAANMVGEMASSSPPARTFSAAIADYLCELEATTPVGAYAELLLDHLVSLGPSSLSQLLRVITSAECADLVIHALEHEAVALGTEADRFDTRLKLGLRGPGSEELFGLLAQSAMSRGYRWKLDEWRTWIDRTPEMRHASSRLVWCSDQQLHFRRTPEGELVDCDDDPVALDESAVISVPHPHDFTDDETTRWSRVFATYDIVSAFPQFDRQMAHVPDSWSKRDAVPLHRGIDRDTAITHLVRNDWSLRKKGTRSFFDRMLRGPTVATISWHASGDVAHLIELYFSSPAGAPAYLGQLDPVAYSEALLTLSELKG